MKGLIYLGLCSALHPSSGEGTLLCHTCYDKSPRLTRSHSGGTFQSNRVASYDKPGVLLRNYCNLYPHTTSGSVVQYHLYAKYLLIIKRALYFVFIQDIKQLNRHSQLRFFFQKCKCGTCLLEIYHELSILNLNKKKNYI